MIWKKCAVLVVASLVFLSTAIGCNKGKTETENKGEGQTAVPVEVVKVEKRDVISYVAATGTICPKLESKVGPRISGRIEKIYADEGDEVKEGEVLIKLEQEELIIAKDQAEATLRFAQANLNKVLAGTREEEIQQAEAGLAQAKANLEDAEVNFLRLKKLFETHTVAKKTFDNAETLYKVAQAQYEAAMERLKMAKKGPTKEDIEIARAQVRQAEVGLQMEKQKIKDSITGAPFSGVVVGKFKNEGEYVTSTPATLVLHLVDMSSVKVEVSIPEYEMASISMGQEVEVKVDAYPDRVFKGEIVTVNPWIDPGSRTFKVKIEIPNRDFSLKGGMFARVTIIKGKREALVIPREAVMRQEGVWLYHVIVVGDTNRAERRVIKPVFTPFGYVEVEEGLKEGEKVVVKGQAALEGGEPLEIVKEEKGHETS